MQILPTTRKETLSDHLFATPNPQADGDATSFADELMRQHSAQQAVDAGETHSVSAAMAAEQQSTAPLVDAPYSRNTTDGITYTVEEVCFTKQDIQELRHKMEQAGAPPETLEGLDKLAQQPDGATLSQVVASLHPLETPPALSESDINTLKSVCDRMDSTGKLGTNVLDLLSKGQGKQALELLTQAMGQLPPGTRVTVDKDEMAVLGKALGLSTGAQKQLMGNFGPYSSVSLNAADFSSFMGPASSEFIQRDANRQKLDKALDATLTPILKKAKDRMQAEKEASELTSRRAEQSKALIQKTMLQNVNATLDGTQAAQAQADQNGQVADNLKQALAGREGQKIANPDGKLDTKTDGKTDGKLNAQDKLNADGTQALQGAGQNADQANNATGKELFTGEDGKNGRGKDDKNDKKNDGWENLLGRTDVRAGVAPTTTTATTSPLVGMAAAAGVQAGTVMENLAAAKGGNDRSHVSRQMASQVEQSMLSAMRDGTKRLELQLHPGELGNLTLSLSVRNGEVSATIRSEKGETAELLTRQLDALRANLEQQGIKVDKLEVQTQLADNNSPKQWDGMHQHNARQEENARRDDLERLRNLGRVRNNSASSSEITLEQGVQLDRRTAGSAAQSIYIVA